MLKRGISSLESVFLEEYIMKQVNCPICNCKCIKHGKIKSGSQRWFCKSCKLAFTPKIDNDTKQLQQFLNWLFSKEVQSNMSGGGRTFRRKTSRFWDIWVMSPKIEESKDVLYLDGIYYVSTVELNKATIKKYIQEQEKHDVAMDKSSVKEYEDPFRDGK